ncbi:MAG: 23S rRNA (pseudouridine(1915)-N(3))-methyltransferase RlmH [Chitinophagaceae bacterium]
MKILFISIGKPNDKQLDAAITDFSGRINRYHSCQWLVIAPPKNAASLSINDLKKAEAVLITDALTKDDFVVLLDEKGKQFSSVELAQFIQLKANESTKRLIFIIGGAFGVDETIVKKANVVWSLSKLVFPHMIVRLLLSEQVYRACTILNNEKYHHI